MKRRGNRKSTSAGVNAIAISPAGPKMMSRQKPRIMIGRYGSSQPPNWGMPGRPRIVTATNNEGPIISEQHAHGKQDQKRALDGPCSAERPPEPGLERECDQFEKGRMHEMLDSGGTRRLRPRISVAGHRLRRRDAVIVHPTRDPGSRAGCSVARKNTSSSDASPFRSAYLAGPRPAIRRTGSAPCSR